MLHDGEMRVVPREWQQRPSGGAIAVGECVGFLGCFRRGVAMHLDGSVDFLTPGLGHQLTCPVQRLGWQREIVAELYVYYLRARRALGGQQSAEFARVA